MSLFQNASPQFIPLGIKDNSGRKIPPETIPIPQHVPLFYIYAKYGPTSRQFVNSNNISSMYGADTFDFKRKWFMHTTRFLNLAMKNNNSAMVVRIVPEDAGPKATAAVYMDVLPTNVPNYKRDSFGNILVDAESGNYLIDETNPTIPGYKIKYIRENVEQDQKVGQLRPKPGTMSSEEVIGIETIKDSFAYLLPNIPRRVKVGDVLKLDGTSVYDQDLYKRVIVDDTDIVGLVNGEYKALEPGLVTITLELTKKPSSTVDVDDARIVFEIEVVEEDETLLTIPNIELTGYKHILTEQCFFS